jgi:hypothetical protein
MARPIERFPTELLDLITADLSLEEFRSLRLSCKAVSVSSIHAFGIRFFSTLTCAITSRSLENLVAISKHVEFSSTLRALDFVPDVPTGDGAAAGRRLNAWCPYTPLVKRHKAIIVHHGFYQRFME